MLAYRPPNRQPYLSKIPRFTRRDMDAQDNITGQECREAQRSEAQSELQNEAMIAAIAANASYYGAAIFRGVLKSRPGMNVYPGLVHVHNSIHSSGQPLSYFRDFEGRLYYFHLETTDDCNRLIRDGRTCNSERLDTELCSIDKRTMYTDTCSAMKSRCETSNIERVVKEDSIFCNVKMPPIIIKYVNAPFTWIYVFPPNGSFAQVYVLD